MLPPIVNGDPGDETDFIPLDRQEFDPAMIEIPVRDDRRTEIHVEHVKERR